MNINADAIRKPLTDEELEALLKPCGKRSRLFAVLAAVSIILAVLFFILYSIYSAKILLFAGILLAVMVFLFGTASGASKHRYDLIFTEHMGAEIEDIISEYFGPELEPAAKTAGAPAKELYERIKGSVQDSGLYGEWNQFSANSYRKGSFKDTVFEAFNAKLTDEQVQNSGEDSSVSTQTRFDGIWVICETKAPAETSLTVVMNSNPKERTEPYWNTVTSNEKFNAQFLIHAEDPSKAGAVLTPDRIRKLTRLADLAEGTVRLLYAGGKLQIALETEHRFQDLAGSNTTHIENLRQNLRASMVYMSHVLDCVC